VSVLEAVAPILGRHGVLFKTPSTILELKRLNCGLFYGFSQVGKFVTAYPQTNEQASALAHELDRATRRFEGPAVPFEQPVAPGSSVFARYGAFGAANEDGSASFIRAPDGELVEDRRDKNPEWAAYPLGLIRQAQGRRRAGGPLATTFRAFRALSQRGKGGVYQALDLSRRPARLCAIKEGRIGGEVDWDGSDGRTHLEREFEVLQQLRRSSAPVPEVYDHFEESGHLYLVLEWLEGESLADALHPDRELLPVDVALDLGRQCASILEGIHSRQWVWRDVKAANLVLCDGVLRPVDFEGAAPAGSAVPVPWGTAGYAPPEWLDVQHASFAQDLYALGVLLHQLFTNLVPEPNQPLPPLDSARPDAPSAVGRLIARLTASPDQRTPARIACGELQTLAFSGRAAATAQAAARVTSPRG
jgi:hypothetical protein